MKQWITLFKHEMVANFRDRKWIWVPLAFILIAVMDPIMNYYLPEILDAVGGLPEDAVFQMPEFTVIDAIMMSFSQLSTLGVLIIALISMGTISGERKSGVAELILVKPVAYSNYITSKWAGLLFLVWASYIVGMLFAWYYIGILYEPIPFSDFLIILFFYGLWLTLIATLSIFYNTLFKSSGLVAFATLGTAILLSVGSSLLGERLLWSPSNMSSHIVEFLQVGEIPGAMYGSAVITLILCFILIVWGIYIFQNKEHAG